MFGPTKRDRCRVCSFEVIAKAGETHPVCTVCTMIAREEKYSDGSDPAEGLSPGEVRYIQIRLASVEQARRQPLV